MIVRDLVSGTTHSKCGRLERGHIHAIDPAYYSPVLFEIIPQSPNDIVVPAKDKKGNIITMKKAREIRQKAFDRFIKTKKKQYDIENKLAIQRLTGGK